MRDWRHRTSLRKSGRSALDRQIAQALDRQAQTVKVSSASAQRMKQRVHRIIEEETGMKQFNLKKMFVVAAAVFVVGGITAIAGGKIVGVSSGSSWNDAVREYGKIDQITSQLDFKAKIPETFSNGYGFSSALPSDSSGQDEKGQKILEWTGINTHYVKDGFPTVTLFADPAYAVKAQKEKNSKSFQQGDITLYYSCTDYLSAPVDYKLTEEEKKQEEQGTLMVGYGSDTLERSRVSSLSWTDGDVTYDLLSFDNTMTAEEFCQMAAEVIGK